MGDGAGAARPLLGAHAVITRRDILKMLGFGGAAAAVLPAVAKASEAGAGFKPIPLPVGARLLTHEEAVEAAGHMEPLTLEPLPVFDPYTERTVGGLARVECGYQWRTAGDERDCRPSTIRLDSEGLRVERQFCTDPACNIAIEHDASSHEPRARVQPTMLMCRPDQEERARKLLERSLELQRGMHEADRLVHEVYERAERKP